MPGDNPPQGGAARSSGQPTRPRRPTSLPRQRTTPPRQRCRYADGASARDSSGSVRANDAGALDRPAGDLPGLRAATQAADLPGRAARRSSRGRRGRKPARAKRGRVLLAAGLAVIVAAGSGTYLYLARGQRRPGPAATAPRTSHAARPSPQPSPAPTGRWGHIQTRRADPQPLTLAELFPARFRVADLLQAQPVRRHDPDRGIADRGREHLGGPARWPGLRPSPTAMSAPTSARTMLWQNASATTVATAMPSPSRRQSRTRSDRMVVAPSRRRQKAAKSCSPGSQRRLVHGGRDRAAGSTTASRACAADPRRAGSSQTR
jgi:hypothetical protein